jgi:hypothetical protein
MFFRRDAHMIAVENIPQTVTDHRIDQFRVAHFLFPCASGSRAGTGSCFSCPPATTMFRIAREDRLHPKGDRAKTGAANLINGHGSFCPQGYPLLIAVWRAGFCPHPAVRTCPRNNVIDVFRFDARVAQGCLNGDGADFQRRKAY